MSNTSQRGDDVSDDKNNPWRLWTEDSPWRHYGVHDDTVLLFKGSGPGRLVTSGPLSSVRSDANVAGLWWRFRDPPLPRLIQKDVLGEPLRAGETYVSSRHGLVPVSVEGVRFLIDKEGAR